MWLVFRDWSETRAFGLKLGTHYPWTRAVFTDREHGCPKWRPCSRAVYTVGTAREHECQKMTPVITGHIGYTTLVTNTARKHGCLLLTAVFMGCERSR